MIKGARNFKRERKIEDMEDGETGFAVPWAVCMLEDGDVFINSKYTIHSRPGGTVVLPITRSGDDYEVNLNIDYKFSISDELHSGFGQSVDDMILIGNIEDEPKPEPKKLTASEELQKKIEIAKQNEAYEILPSLEAELDLLTDQPQD